MSKTWHTKKKILKLISKGAKTPGEISDELGLAPSTVSEHIEELEGMGAVEQVDNPFIKKWKYYKPNPNFDLRSISALKRVSNIPQIAAALAVVLGVIALFIFGVPALGAFGAGHTVVFSLTDPPSVPSGTQALNITYSSLQAHYVSSGNSSANVSAWVSGSGGGSLDLMKLVNSSQVIGTGSIPVNSTINIVRFDITSAYIVINGTKYSVTVPSGELTVPVTSGGRVTSNSSVLIDLSPVVTTIYTGNSTVFVLVPSVRAVLVGNVSAHVGERHTLTGQEQDELSAETPVIGISSASLKVISNSTVQLSVTVKNDANETVDLRHVILFGTPSVTVSSMGANSEIEAQIDAIPEFMHANISSNAGASESGQEMMNAEANDVPEVINGVNVMIEEHGNGSVEESMHNLSREDTRGLEDLVRVGAEVRSFRVLNFLATANGTLVLPRLGEDNGSASNGLGFVLKPGASATLTFTGQILYAGEHIRITPIIGSSWKLVVQGEEDARAITNVTVT